jgi:hypothetical protein
MAKQVARPVPEGLLGILRNKRSAHSGISRIDAAMVLRFIDETDAVLSLVPSLACSKKRSSASGTPMRRCGGSAGAGARRVERSRRPGGLTTCRKGVRVETARLQQLARSGRPVSLINRPPAPTSERVIVRQVVESTLQVLVGVNAGPEAARGPPRARSGSAPLLPKLTRVRKPASLCLSFPRLRLAPPQ